MSQALKIGYCGETKVGKSHLAASIVKEFDGLILDFAAVYQTKRSKGVPQYIVSSVTYGEAYPACKNAGINIQKQYIIIKSREDLENAIEYAFAYREQSEKPNKRIWMVFDDTTMWRWHEGIFAMETLGHQMITREDWGVATSNMIATFRRLEGSFNLLFINQKQDIYKDGESTGERKGKWFPGGVEYALDVAGELMVDLDRREQLFKVLANRMAWVCDPNYVDVIVNPTPKKLFDALRIPEDLR